MLNDATLLTLTFQDDAPDVITPEQLTGIVKRLESIFRTAYVSFGECDVTLLLVASPQSGSLRFFLKPRFKKLPDKARLASHLRRRPDDQTLVGLAAYAGIGAFLWMVVFGGRGIADFFQHAPEQEPSQLADEELKRATRDLLISQKELRNEIRKEFLALASAAQVARAVQIEIQLPDEPAVVLYCRDGTRKLPRNQPIVLKQIFPSEPFYASVTTIKEPMIGILHGEAQYLGIPGFVRNYSNGTDRLRNVPVLFVWPVGKPTPKFKDHAKAELRSLRDPGKVQYFGIRTKNVSRAKAILVVDQIVRDTSRREPPRSRATRDP